MTDYVANEDELSIGGVHKLRFAHRIAQVEDFGSVAVLRVEAPPGIRYNENIFGVSAKGRLLWQVQVETHVYEDSPYTNLSRKGALAVISNWDGALISLEPATGTIVERNFGK